MDVARTGVRHDGLAVLEDVGGAEQLEVVGLIVVGHVQHRQHVVVFEHVAKELLHH
jgi:NaMN:DMB phosphoribosyltransferase